MQGDETDSVFETSFQKIRTGMLGAGPYSPTEAVSA